MTQPVAQFCSATITPVNTVGDECAGHPDVDHLLPRSRGGETTWENVVTACRTCNMRKGDRTPDEAHMILRRRPGRPHYLASCC